MNLIKSLVVSDKVASLSGLEHAVSLTSFKMENSSVIDLSPLSGCKSLVDVVFDSCSITDLSPLKDGLIYLQRIEIYNNQGDIDFRSLPKRYLKKLTVKDSNITDISGLENFAVSYLDLSGNKISDISSISSLRLVEILNLKSNNISDISSISNFNNLQNLDLSSNKVGDDGLFHLPVMLQTLNIENNNINSYEGLIFAPNLSSVFIFGNPTTSLAEDVLHKLRERRVLIGGMTNNN